jgi:hypothetical protein
METEKRNIYIVNGICILVGLIPIVGLFVIPLLFIVNLIIGLAKYNSNQKELGTVYLITAFIAPLIGFSLCLGVYSSGLINI